MKYHYYSYGTGKGKKPLYERKENMPQEVLNELLNDDRLVNEVYVDKAKQDVVDKLDKLLKIGKAEDYFRTEHLEVSSTNIDEYDFFRVSFKKALVVEDYTPPTCPSGMCTRGVGINEPYILKSTKSLDIGQIDMIQSTTFVLSSKMKKVFIEEGITGLEYHVCQDKGAGESDYSVAKVTNRIYEDADSIYLNTYCESCGTIMNYIPFGLRLDRDSVLDLDFQMINGIRVNDKVYNYPVPTWICSKKALKVLLREKVKGMGVKTFFLKEKFIPQLLSDKSVANESKRGSLFNRVFGK